MKFVKIILITLALTGCASNFSRVPFKYTNLAHMNYREAMTEVSTPPEDLVFALSEAFRKNGANVIDRTKLDFIIVENADAQKCWEATNDIFQQEFGAYRANKYSMFTSIDRVTPFSSRQIAENCTFFTNTKSNADSWFLRIELPPRTAQTTLYQPTTDSFFMFGQNKTIQGFTTSYIPEQASISISTRLYIWAWRIPGNNKTNIYIHAKPVSGQIEADIGNSIGHTWWQLANGYSEQQTVKNYLFLIQEYDRGKGAPK